MPTIYEVPLVLEEEGIGNLLVSKLNLKDAGSDLTEWRKMVDRLKEPHQAVKIALVGKYIELEDAYYSVREALCHAALYHDRGVEIEWIQSEDLEKEGGEDLLRSAQGIIVPGGFGERGVEGKVKAARYARRNKIPYLGLCLGMQTMVVEFGRHIFSSEDTNSTEFEKNPSYPVIDIMSDQKDVTKKGGTMRLGNYPCKLAKSTLAAWAYRKEDIEERHRHRFEFNNKYTKDFEKAGMVFSGKSPDGKLVEICEIKDHPFMLGCQFHPEFGSRPNRPHPLFRDYINAAKEVLREGAQTELPLNDE